MHSRKWMFLAVALLVALAWSPQLPAQTQTTGDVTGVVTDQSGGVVPQAKVSLKDNAKGSTQQTETGKDGVYHFYLLQPGSYTVAASAANFQPLSQPVQVNVGQIATVNLQLAVSGANTTITVTEQAPLLQTENGNVTATINEQQITQIPNPGNDLSFIAQLAPGSVMNTSSFGGLGNFSSFGISATANLFTLDGMDDNDPFLSLNNTGATNLALGTNEIQEASVVANGYSGQYGGLAGANINYVTKSGGNDFHGNAIYYWNGDAMNAKDWFAGSSPKLFSNANQWAASLGGPIKRDKAFFYFNTEGLRVVLPVQFPTTVVPTPSFEAATIANLNGRGLSASVPFYNQMFSLYDQAAIGQAVTPTPCSAVAPTVTTADGNCTESFNSGASSFTHEYQISGRADYNVGPNDRAFLRIWYDKGFQASITDPISRLFNVGSTQPQWSGQLNETHSFGSTMTNQFIASFLYYQAVFDLTNRAAALAAFPTTVDLADGSLTSMGGTCCNANGDANFPNGRNVTQYGFSDDLSKTWGSHTFSVGAKFRRNDVKDFDYGQLNTGTVSVSTLTDLFNGGPNAAGTGDSLRITFPSSPTEQLALYTLGVYGQDEWRLKPNFTLTLALRVEHQSNPVCNSNCFARLTGPFLGLDHDPTIPYNQAILTGLNRMLASLDGVLWQPRIGFAWQPFGAGHNTVLRGGVGIFNDAFTGSAVDFFSENSPQENLFVPSNLPISPAETNGGNLFTQAQLSNQAFLSGFANGLTEAQIAGSVPGFVAPGFSAADRHSHIPQYQKWNLEIQQGFGAKTSLSVNYVGNHGIHELIQNGSVNAFCAPGSTACPAGAFADLPTAALDPRLGLVFQYQSIGVSNYEGVAVSLNHRFTSWGGGQFGFNYGYGHAFDVASNGGLSNIPFSFLTTAAIPQDPFNVKKSYGPADYDVRHNLNFNYVWGLPIRQAFGGRGWAPAVEGWQVSGTLFYHTGLPFSVIDGVTGAELAGSNYGAFVLPAPLAGTPTSCGAAAALTPCLTLDQFNAPGSVNFQGTPAAFTSGLRNAFRGPGYFDTDFTIVKNTKIPHWERGELGIGFQFYNILNHPNFQAPFPVVQSSLFGQIIGTVSPPTSILGSGLGGDSSPRIIQLKAEFKF
jgi:outer membrane receptor protein involved in Fe transport